MGEQRTVGKLTCEEIQRHNRPRTELVCNLVRLCVILSRRGRRYGANLLRRARVPGDEEHRRTMELRVQSNICVRDKHAGKAHLVALPADLAVQPERVPPRQGCPGGVEFILQDVGGRHPGHPAALWGEGLAGVRELRVGERAVQQAFLYPGALARGAEVVMPHDAGDLSRHKCGRLRRTWFDRRRRAGCGRSLEKQRVCCDSDWREISS